PRQRAPRQGAAEPVQPRRLDLENGHRSSIARFESELGIEVVAGERPGKSFGSAHGAHEQDAARGGAPEKRRAIGSSDLPARAFGDAAAIRTHTGDAGPPVRKMVRLGDELPDVVARREKLTRGGGAWHDLKTSFSRYRAGRAAGARGTRSNGAGQARSRS